LPVLPIPHGKDLPVRGGAPWAPAPAACAACAACAALGGA